MAPINSLKAVRYGGTDEFFIYDIDKMLSYHIPYNTFVILKTKDFVGQIVHYPLWPLERIAVNITNRCNMSCVHCINGDLRSNNDIGIELFWSIIQQAKSMGVLAIAMTGGEPLLHKNIINMITLTRSNSISPNLQTNGLNLDNSMLNNLIKSGLRNLTISLDCISKDAWKSIRGDASFGKTVLSNIKQLKPQKSISITINTVLSRLNAPELIAISTFLKNLDQKICWNLNSLAYLGNAFSNKDDLKLSKAELIACVEESFKSVQRSKIKLSIGMLLTHEIFDFLKTCGNISQEELRPCCGHIGELAKFCVIHTDGSVTPCHALQTGKIGDLKQSSLSTIWNSELMGRYKRHRHGAMTCGLVNKVSK